MSSPSDLRNKLDEIELLVGESVLEHRGILRITHPMEHGVVTNWDDMEKVWNHMYSESCLRYNYIVFHCNFLSFREISNRSVSWCLHLIKYSINSDEHPVLLTEVRERLPTLFLVILSFTLDY